MKLNPFRITIKTLALLLVIALAMTTEAQDTTFLRRTPYKLKVAVDKKSVYEEDIGATAYVLPNKVIQLYPGETIFVEFEEENGKLLSMKAVEKIIKPEKTVTISFTQAVKKKVHEGVSIVVHNPFAINLNYSCRIFLLKQQKWVDTNVYPVDAKLMGIETWPDIITSIALGDFELKK